MGAVQTGVMLHLISPTTPGFCAAQAKAYLKSVNTENCVLCLGGNEDNKSEMVSVFILC